MQSLKGLLRDSYHNNQFSKRITKPLEVRWGYILFFNVPEEGWVRRRGKGEGGCGEIFLLNCLSESHSLFPGFACTQLYRDLLWLKFEYYFSGSEKQRSKGCPNCSNSSRGAFYTICNSCSSKNNGGKTTSGSILRAISVGRISSKQDKYYSKDGALCISVHDK